MSVKALILACSLLLLNAGISYAGDIKCRDVVSLAEVDFPPGVAVSYTSGTDPERFCRFSINGYVADNGAPPEIKNTIGVLSKQYAVLMSSEKVTGKFMVNFLPFLLFAADNHIDLKLLSQTSFVLNKDRRKFENCYDKFFSKEEVEPAKAEYEGINLRCAADNGGNQIETMLTVAHSPITRATYISR